MTVTSVLTAGKFKVVHADLTSAAMATDVGHQESPLITIASRRGLVIYGLGPGYVDPGPRAGHPTPARRSPGIWRRKGPGKAGSSGG